MKFFIYKLNVFINTNKLKVTCNRVLLSLLNQVVERVRTETKEILP